VRYVESLGLRVPTAIPLRVEIEGRSIAVFHGHEPQFLTIERAVLRNDARLLADAAGGRRYVLHGHSHVPRDVRLGEVRVINPGALHRAARHTVATLDPARDEVRFSSVD
jgi:predicted phosphodiesterase